jgi:hypothetical protein
MTGAACGPASRPDGVAAGDLSAFESVSHPSALKRLRSFRLARGLRLRRSAWRAARTARGLPGGLPSSPQPLACGYGWGEIPGGTRARCGEAPVGGRAGKVALFFLYSPTVTVVNAMRG